MNVTTSIVEFIQQFFEKAGVPYSMLAAEVLTSCLLFIAAIVIGWLVYHIFERYLVRWAKKTKTTLDDEILKNIKAPIYVFVIIIGAFYGLEFLSFIKPYSTELSIIFSLAEIGLVTLIIIRIINVLIAWYAERSKHRGKDLSIHILYVLKRIFQLIVIIFAFLAVLAAFNIDLTGVVVGLGVTGIVIGFALQNILVDVFSAFSIYFDRPYEIGDFIIIGSDMGIVKKIGIKSTRIQTLQGEELIVSNNEMVNTRIQNFKKMKKRRITFSFGVIYSTPLKKLKKIPGIITDIISRDNLPNVDRLDRVHFKNFGDFSLNFEVVYYLKTNDYNRYMDTQQQINFLIKEAFEKEGIEMAFPTQTIFLNK
jgi:small-conductance mechanosensitive channel